MNETLRPLDFAVLRDLLDPWEVLRLCNWQATSKPGYPVRGPCPFHGSTSHTSRTLEVQAQTVRCFKCRVVLDSVGIYSRLRHLAPLEAAHALCEWFGVEKPFLHR
jgi:hypothetical protein